MFNILLVDDEQNVLEYLKNLITGDNGKMFDIFTASNVNDAIDILKKHPIDITVSDIKMPERSGIELMHHIVENYPGCKVLLLTAFDDFNYIYEANKLNVKFLLKIEDDEVIVQTIQELLMGEYAKKPQRAELNKPVTQEDLMKKLADYIDNNYEKELSLDSLSRMVYLNPSYCSRIFKQYFKKNIFEYVNEVRMSKAKELLLGTNLKIKDISFKVGYQSLNYFSFVFKQYFGCTPQEFRRIAASQNND